jgi:Holliday junction DNA helicase RuvA
MISSVRGTVLAIAGNQIVVEVGGVGLAVQVTAEHALSLRLGSEATLRTALIVREDDLSLFGFRDADELTVFDALRGVTGVGPKSALGVLGAMDPGQIVQAVALEDDAAFRKVTGIGPKTAKLIVLSLTGKLSVSVQPRRAAVPRVTSVSDSVLAALVGLGWNDRMAAQAVEDALVAATEAERSAVPALLRLALTRLGPAAHTPTGTGS